MESTTPDFYLSSTDTDALSEPRKCYVIKKISFDNQRDLLAVRINPPINGQSFGFSEKVKILILAPHKKGVSLAINEKFPIDVYVLIISSYDQRVRTHFKLGELQLVYWGEIYQTYKDAENRGKRKSNN
jgi:hypothetical protein